MSSLTDVYKRQCLAGAVYAAAVILPTDFKKELLNDAKQLTEKQRYTCLLDTSIKSEFCAKLVPRIVVRVVAVAYTVQVELLHQLDVVYLSLIHISMCIRDRIRVNLCNLW